jgi:hypothetical protein
MGTHHVQVSRSRFTITGAAPFTHVLLLHRVARRRASRPRRSTSTPVVVMLLLLSMVVRWLLELQYRSTLHVLLERPGGSIGEVGEHRPRHFDLMLVHRRHRHVVVPARQGGEAQGIGISELDGSMDGCCIGLQCATSSAVEALLVRYTALLLWLCCCSGTVVTSAHFQAHRAQ